MSYPNLCSRILLLLVSSLLVSCDQKDLSYFPLTEGIEWRYRVILKASGSSEQSRYYLRSEGSREYEGREYHVHRSLTGTQTLFSITDSGVEKFGYVLRQEQTPVLLEDKVFLIPYPEVEGYEWENTIRTRLLIRKGAPGESSILANVPAENVIESLNETVQVPAGKFKNCMKISTDGFAFHSGTQHKSRTLVEIKESRWYARGVGLVKSIRLETSTSDAFGTREEIFELESVTLP